MPTYDYKCGACDYTFELFQPISARRIRRCPECGKPKVKRLIGAGSTIIFKGSGFYQTDYRSEEYKSRLEAEKSPATSDSKNKQTKKKKNAKD